MILWPKGGNLSAAGNDKRNRRRRGQQQGGSAASGLTLLGPTKGGSVTQGVCMSGCSWAAAPLHLVISAQRVNKENICCIVFVSSMHDEE